MFHFATLHIRRCITSISSSSSTFTIPKTRSIQQLPVLQIRGDTIVALCIPIACITVLIEAYYRTNYHDADTSYDAQFIPSNECIMNHHSRNCSTNHPTNDGTTPISATIAMTALSTSQTTIVQQLERDGIVIIPNAISTSILNGARYNIQHHFQQNNNNSNQLFEFSTNDSDVRQDKITWICSTTIDNCDLNSNNNNNNKNETYDIDDGDNENFVGKDLDYCIRFIRGITYALEMNGYSTSSNHRIPKQCQLAVYTGDTVASYMRHLDTCISTIYELGILEYFRLSDYRERRITIILYLNDAHRPIHHGGALRCWISKANHEQQQQEQPPNIQNQEKSSIRSDDNFYPSFDVQPVGGTLVIFQSQRVEHQVLPSSVDRYALTNWVNSAS